MSDEPDSPVSKDIIQEQMDECISDAGEIIEANMDVGAETDIYRNIDYYLDNLKEATEDCFSDRKETSKLHDQLKWLLRGLVEERGMKEKIKYGDGGHHDNPVNLCYWFKLYATVGLNEPVEIENIVAIRSFNKYREDEISHPDELPSPGQETDPVLLSYLLLLWWAIEELIDLWVQLHDEDDLDTRLQLLRGDHEFHIGFISELKKNHGYITSYQEGEAGQSIRMQPQHVGYFPSEGDIVQLKAEQQYKDEAETKPHRSLTPVVDYDDDTDYHRIEPYT